MFSTPTLLDDALAEAASGVEPKICELSDDVLSAGRGAPIAVALTSERREIQRLRIAANGSFPLVFGTGWKHASSHAISQWQADHAHREIQFNGANPPDALSELMPVSPFSALALSQVPVAQEGMSGLEDQGSTV